MYIKRISFKYSLIIHFYKSIQDYYIQYNFLFNYISFQYKINIDRNFKIFNYG